MTHDVGSGKSEHMFLARIVSQKLRDGHKELVDKGLICNARRVFGLSD